MVEYLRSFSFLKKSFAASATVLDCVKARMYLEGTNTYWSPLEHYSFSQIKFGVSVILNEILFIFILMEFNVE